MKEDCSYNFLSHIFIYTSSKQSEILIVYARQNKECFGVWQWSSTQIPLILQANVPPECQADICAGAVWGIPATVARPSAALTSSPHPATAGGPHTAQSNTIDNQEGETKVEAPFLSRFKLRNCLEKNERRTWILVTLKDLASFDISWIIGLSK